MDVYILVISFLFGVVGFGIALFEIRTIHLFVVRHQNLNDVVPQLDNKNAYQSKDLDIRKFRRFLLKKDNKNNIHFSIIRKRIILLNTLSITSFVLFGFGIALFYFK